MSREWHRRWISTRQINRLKEYKKRWKNEPEAMLKLNEKARRAALLAKDKRKRDLIKAITTRADLVGRTFYARELLDVVDPHVKEKQCKNWRLQAATDAKRLRNKKAMIKRLQRWGVLVLDPVTLTWRLLTPP